MEDPSLKSWDEVNAALKLIRDNEIELELIEAVFVHATLHSCKPVGIAACPQFLTEKRENAKCFPEFPEKLD